MEEIKKDLNTLSDRINKEIHEVVSPLSNDSFRWLVTGGANSNELFNTTVTMY